MIRLSAAATNVLATRAKPVAARVLPTAVLVAFALPTSCCATAEAAVVSHECITSSGNSGSRCGGSGASSPGSSPSPAATRRPRGLGAGVISSPREPLRRNAAVATAAPPPAASSSSSPGGAQPLCDPSAYQSLSLLIILHECTRRVYGRYVES